MEDVIEINGEKYRKESLAGGSPRIVILQRGWVKVGRFFQDGVNCRLENCSTIRRWGTTKGLGEIADGGPTKDTILDKEPTCRFHELTIIATIDCEEAKWSKYL
jgi:hypothetical protein